MICERVQREGGKIDNSWQLEVTISASNGRITFRELDTVLLGGVAEGAIRHLQQPGGTRADAA
jgi:hypothetical protein